MPFTPRPFRPASWAPGPHAQTLLARGLRSSEGPHFQRERLTTPDDDFLDLDWCPDPGPDAPIVLVLHGLEGSARRRYVRNVCRELLAHGMRPAALNLRGCSGEPNKALVYYHSGKTDDPAFVLETLRARYPGRRLGAIGFSLGGNVLLKLMGERDYGGRALLDAAVAMSVPYDLAAGSALLEQSVMGRAYSGYFLRSLKRKVRWKEDRLRPVLDVTSALAARTIWEFDERITAPLNGFASADDYYARASSSRFLAGVRVPTLLLHSTDDPFLPPACVPVEPAERNPALHLVLHPQGGHVGFLAGSPWRPSFWGDEESARFLDATLIGF
ncbi:MAG: alpha/beta fold hydrolase [Gemmatimonadetes bacterium]|nr:alpha/beta fold hydrolase [Gemmatimonadota bacterium]